MKVTVTHLKAPWPAGTEPGHVVELLGVDAIPAWAVGKCVPAADDAEALATWSPPGFVAQLVVNPASEGDAITGEGSGQALPEITADPVTEAQAAPADAAPAEAAPAATPARKRAQAATG